MPQSDRSSLLQCLLQIVHSLVVHIVVEVHIHPRGLVVDQEPAGLGQREALRILIDEYRTDCERSLHQHLHDINRQSRLLSHLTDRQPFIAVAQQVENTKLQHQPRCLKHHWRPGYPLCSGLSLAGREMLCRICLF